MLFAIRDSAEAIARRAGALLQEYAARADNHVEYKTSDINLVTLADKAAEALIIELIQAAYPDHYIHGEEGGGYGPPAERAPFRWYVDPVDGTTNFAHGFPVYAVNLSVVDEEGEPVVGITYDPTRDECFSAVKGHGVTLNGKPVHVTQADTLLRSLVGSGFPYDRHTAKNNNTAAWAAFARRAQGVRRGGAAALDIAYVACGRLDGYWERGPQPWDFMAGILMVREAGGMVTTYSGSTDGLYDGPEILASNGRIHQQMVDVLMEVEAAFNPDSIGES
jgi:myo-inositol-1(or 4)-monophosphatase